jgi:quercetin dioxygenase-like cupin family protein
MNDSVAAPDLAADRKEIVSHEGRTLCVIVRATPLPKATTFFTPDDFNMQVGNIVYPAGGEIPRHTHRKVTRSVAGTSEVLVVQKGRVLLDLYTDDREFVCSRELAQGDVLVLVAGGHGFRVLEDTVLLEVKQGPYGGLQEKDRF